MALPKKGLRKINVQEKTYYWTVKTSYQSLCFVVGIGLVSEPNKHVMFLIKHKDPWLHFPEKTYNEVNRITPKLIRDAIVFANSNNDIKWSGKKDSVFQYEEGQFMVFNR